MAASFLRSSLCEVRAKSRENILLKVIGASDYNTIDVEGFISTQGYSADGVSYAAQGGISWYFENISAGNTLLKFSWERRFRVGKYMDFLY